jgi:hypothetical protein
MGTHLKTSYQILMNRLLRVGNGCRIDYLEAASRCLLDRGQLVAKASRITLPTPIPPRIVEAAHASEIIRQKMAVFEFAFNHPATGERRSSKLTALEYDADQRCNVEHRAIEIAVLKDAVNEVRVYVRPLFIKTRKRAVLEEVVAPVCWLF